MTDRPKERAWYEVVDPEVSYLTDEELDDYVRTWSARRRELEASGESFSAYWAGKVLDRGARERSRRSYRAQLAQSPPPHPPSETTSTRKSTPPGEDTDDQH